MSVFRKVRKAQLQVASSLKKDTWSASEKEKWLRKSAALSEVYSYIYAGSWLVSDSTRERVQAYLDSGLKIKEVAARFGVSENGFSVAMSAAGKRLEAKLGGDVIGQIMADRVDQALLAFRVATGDYSVLGLLSPALIDLLPEAKKSASVSLANQAALFSFLQYFTTSNLRKLVSRFDVDALAHIRYIVDSTDEAYGVERQLLHKLLLDDGTYTGKDLASIFASPVLKATEALKNPE